MFCQIATGSLLLSATGVLQHDREGFGAPPVLSYHTVATRRSTLRASILPLPRCQRAFCGAKNRVIEASSQYHSRSEEHTSELQSPDHLVCRLLLEKKKTKQNACTHTYATH